MYKYIKASRTIKPSDFKWVEDEYTGGNIIIVYGQLADGRYFYASDADYAAYILDSDPMEPDGDEGVIGDEGVVGDSIEWLEEHPVVELTEQDMYRFWLALFQYCEKHNVHLYTYDNYNPVIKELKTTLRGG